MRTVPAAHVASPRGPTRSDHRQKGKLTVRSWIRPPIIIIALVVVPMPAWSVIVKTKDGKEYKGHQVKNDLIQLTMRLDGSSEEKIILHANIATVVQNVQFKQLEKLKPGEPRAYY